MDQRSEIPEVNTSYKYVTEFLEDSLKLAQELQKSQERYKKYYDRKAKPRRLEVGDQVLILLLTDSNKLLMQWRGLYIVESRVGAIDYRVKMRSKTKTYHVNMFKKYIGREPEVDVVHTSNKDDATTAVARVIYQDTDMTRRYHDLFTDMPRETDVIQHRLKLTDDTPICCKPYSFAECQEGKLRN